MLLLQLKSNEYRKELSKLGSIPQVNKHAQLITEIQDKYFWEKSSIKI